MAEHHLMTRIDPRILCTDPRFVPTPVTDIRRTFERARAELESGKAASWPVRVVIVRGTVSTTDQE